MNVIEKSTKYVLNTYKRYPLVFESGKGVFLFTPDGEKFLDMASGIAVSSLGHSHPLLVEAIKEQAEKLIHISNLYYSKPYVELAEKLIKNSIFDKVFFCNSGAEANEAALKLARKYGNNIKRGKNQIIAMKNSFHGRTIATVSITGQEKYQKGFEPLLQNIKFVQYNNINSFKRVINKNTCAVIIEPIQAEGGVINAEHAFLKVIRELCSKYDAILIFDEVQTGVGRTGTLFAYEHYLPVEPDIMTLAKGLAGGLPIGVMLVKEKFANVLNQGEHASTFGGNLVSCRAANVVLDVLTTTDLLKQVRENSSYFKEKLFELQEKYKLIEEIRGRGYLIGIKLSVEAQEFINALIEEKIIAVPAGNNVVRFLPPLIAEKSHFDILIEALNKICKNMSDK